MKSKYVLLTTLATSVIASCSYFPTSTNKADENEAKKAIEILNSVATHKHTQKIAKPITKPMTKPVMSKATSSLPNQGSKPVSTRWDNQGLSGAVNNMPDDVFVLAPKHKELDTGADKLNNYLKTKAKNPKTFTKKDLKGSNNYKPKNKNASKNDYSIYGKSDIEKALTKGSDK